MLRMWLTHCVLVEDALARPVPYTVSCTTPMRSARFRLRGIENGRSFS